MRVLFVCSGNSKSFDVIPFIKEQGSSLSQQGIDVSYFPVIGKGLAGYLKAGLKLRKYLRHEPYDLIHAHFTHSGWAAVIGAAGKTPIVLSLMGSDAYGEYVGANQVKFSSRVNTLLTYAIQPFVNAIISKSKNIAKYVFLKHKSYIIPNGVNIRKFMFKPTDAGDSENVGEGKKLILFLANKANPRKNFKLVQEAVAHLHRSDLKLVSPYPVSHSEIPRYLSSAAVVVVASFMEGSPNVVKEAMVSNCPVVSTNIGDVEWVLGNTAGCYVTSFSVEDFAEKLRLALEFSGQHHRTNGIDRIRELGLDAETVSKRVIRVYEKVLNRHAQRVEVPVSLL